MKYISTFLILNMLLLSNMPGIADIYNGKAACIKKMHNDCSKHSKQDTKDDCGKGNCNVMLSCSTCGFIVTQPVSFSPVIIDLHQLSLQTFEVGALSDYHDNGWNPPKA